jgi:hypothetical protein
MYWKQVFLMRYPNISALARLFQNVFQSRKHVDKFALIIITTACAPAKSEPAGAARDRRSIWVEKVKNEESDPKIRRRVG